MPREPTYPDTTGQVLNMESQVLQNPVSAQLRALPSGRSVVLKVGDGGEEMEIRSPDGDVEVRITLTDQGAVVSLRGGQLQMQAADAITMNCRRLEVLTTEGTALGSAATSSSPAGRCGSKPRTTST